MAGGGGRSVRARLHPKPPTRPPRATVRSGAPSPALGALYTRARFSRSALLITDTELKLMAAAAIIGLSRMPKRG